MQECVRVPALVREEFSPLSAMGEPEHHADRVMWHAPAVSDTLSDALSDVARARHAHAHADQAEPKVSHYELAWHIARVAPLDVSLLRGFPPGPMVPPSANGSDSCLFCGRCRGARLSHLVRCRPLWNVVSQATGLTTPRSLTNALGLDEAAAAPTGARATEHRVTDSEESMVEFCTCARLRGGPSCSEPRMSLGRVRACRGIHGSPNSCREAL